MENSSIRYSQDKRYYRQRTRYAKIICEMINTGFNRGYIIFFLFQMRDSRMDGCVHYQNYRVWRSQKNYFIVFKPLHLRNITVWNGLCANGILGLYFFRLYSGLWQYLFYNKIHSQFLFRKLDTKRTVSEECLSPTFNRRLVQKSHSNIMSSQEASVIAFVMDFLWPPSLNNMILIFINYVTIFNIKPTKI